MGAAKNILENNGETLKVFSQYYDDILDFSDLPGHYSKFMKESRGKMLRPLMCLLSADACGKITERTYLAASLIEMLHNAALVHDDVIDESVLRRGKPTFNALYGGKNSILFGDYIISKVFSIASKRREHELLDVLIDVFHKMSIGEIIQIEENKKTHVDELKYYEIVKYKTAVLIAACCKLGAMTATNDLKQIDAMHEFGLSLGMAYQIRDDIFDYRTNLNTGKTANNDLLEKKLTLPMIYSLFASDKNEHKRIKDILKNGIPARNDILFMIDFAEKGGGMKYSDYVSEDFVNMAEHALDNLPESKSKKELLRILDFAVKRNF